MPDLLETPPEAAELLAALRRLAGERKIAIEVDPRRLNHIDSPVASEADGNIWVYGGVGIAALLLWWKGPVPAVAVLAVGALLYLTLGRAYVHRRIERRVHEKALNDLAIWRKLWRFPGLRLKAAGMTECISPDGNWMAFVRTALPSAASLPGSGDLS
ncbi:MAG TPA: hypothetical protein VGU20_02785 [Stellaceae bacterium]|nr:hypothetical protein [Stellaceae bacterium]